MKRAHIGGTVNVNTPVAPDPCFRLHLILACAPHLTTEACTEALDYITDQDIASRCLGKS